MTPNDPPHPEMRVVVSELAERFIAARARYDELVASRDRQQARVEFGSSWRLDMEPLHFERVGYPPGDVLDAAPEHGFYVEDYFDSRGRWICTREEAQFGFYEEFFEHSASNIDGTRFDYHASEKAVINCTRAGLRDGETNYYARFAQHGWSYELYARDVTGRVVTIESVHATKDEDVSRSLTRVTYAADGTLQTIVQASPAGEESLYRRASPTPDDVLVEEIVDGLVRTVPAAAADLAGGDTAYCLALFWWEANDDRLPPDIGVGLERQRERWLRGNGPSAEALVYSVGDFSATSDNWCIDHSLVASCGELRFRLRQSGQWQVFDDLLAETTRRLRQLDWRSILSITDDFRGLRDGRRASASSYVVAHRDVARAMGADSAAGMDLQRRRRLVRHGVTRRADTHDMRGALQTSLSPGAVRRVLLVTGNSCLPARRSRTLTRCRTLGVCWLLRSLEQARLPLIRTELHWMRQLTR